MLAAEILCFVTEKSNKNNAQGLFQGIHKLVICKIRTVQVERDGPIRDAIGFN